MCSEGLRVGHDRSDEMMSLRSRLLLTTVVLLAAAVVIVDVAAATALRAHLTGQLDQRLLDVRRPVAERAGPIPKMSELVRPGDSVAGRQQARNDMTLPSNRGIGFSDLYVELRRFDGTIYTSEPSILGDDEPLPAITDDLVVAHLDGRPFTIASEGDRRYKYRAIVTSAADGTGAVTVAAPLSAVDAAVGRLVRVEILATIVVLCVLMSIGWMMIRADLKPLDNMAETATAIAAGDLSRRVDRADDRTEVGRLGAALNAMLHRIETSFAEREQSAERLRRFAADASHELRTPLTAVKGYAEMYRRGMIQDDEHLARVMGRVESEATRMASVVEDLLLLARLDQGREFERDIVDIEQIVADVVSDARASDPQRVVDMSVSSSDGLSVSGDAGKLHQVFANLLTNACTHTLPGTPVHVSVARSESVVEVVVSDEGKGIAASDLEKVFERFYRSDSGRSRDEGGSGLGLSIVKSIVEAHGGSVVARSEKGSGATFTVRLPAAAEAGGSS